MKFLKSFEHINSSYENFTKEELIKIDNIIDELGYMITDEGYNIKKLKGHQSEGTYRYRLLIYQTSNTDVIQKHNDFQNKSKSKIINSEEFSEFLDRIKDDLGDDYLIYVESEWLLYVIIEKIEKV